MADSLTVGRNNWIKFLDTLSDKSRTWSILNGDISALKRQVETVQLLILAYKKKKPGVILADDVGLGKTWIGIIAAIAWASADKSVIVVCPSEKLRNKWLDEFDKWCGYDPNPALWCWQENLQQWEQRHPGNKIGYCIYKSGRRVIKNRIMLLTSNQFIKERDSWNCDLLIVDEAHRGVNEGGFMDTLPSQTTAQFRILMTATPFGKQIRPLVKLLKAVGCQDEIIERSQTAWKMLHKETELDAQSFEDTIRKLRSWIIRHTIETLPLTERKRLGKTRHIFGRLLSHENFEGIPFDNFPNYGELILHIERLKSLFPSQFCVKESLVAPYSRDGLLSIISDNKFQQELTNSPSNKSNAASYHIERIKFILNNHAMGPMETELYEFSKRCFTNGEKFIVFCYHHQVADTVLDILKKAAISSEIMPEYLTDEQISNIAKNLTSRSKVDLENHEDELNINRDNLPNRKSLPFLKSNFGNPKFDIEEAASELGDIFYTQANLEIASRLGSGHEIIRKFFNSPFYPMALVATTKDSEGIDLHRYCRIIVHYELGYRPETLLQANGRIRRLGSLSGQADKPALYYYPYLKCSRSEVLTREVVKRVERFSHFMGGIPDITEKNLMVKAISPNENTIEQDMPELDFTNGGYCKSLFLS